MHIALTEIYIYPVKSCSPRRVPDAAVEPRGLSHDRRWMVVDSEGRGITGRQFPRLTRLAARPTADGLELAAPHQPAHLLPTPPADGERLAARVWRGVVPARTARPADDAWISAFLEHPARWVFMDAEARRPVPDALARPDDEVSFADAFPLLLLAQESVDGLNARLAAPVSTLRFRPNLVVSGVEPHAEDRWRQVRIGEVAFDVVGPCKRCVFTTVDPDAGALDPSGEPLRTLSDYRRTTAGVMFGVNIIARGRGTITAGDAVVPLA